MASQFAALEQLQPHKPGVRSPRLSDRNPGANYPGARLIRALSRALAKRGTPLNAHEMKHTPQDRAVPDLVKASAPTSRSISDRVRKRSLSAQATTRPETPSRPVRAADHTDIRTTRRANCYRLGARRPRPNPRGLGDDPRRTQERPSAQRPHGLEIPLRPGMVAQSRSEALANSQPAFAAATTRGSFSKFTERSQRKSCDLENVLRSGPTNGGRDREPGAGRSLATAPPQRGK